LSLQVERVEGGVAGVLLLLENSRIISNHHGCVEECLFLF
jgi:hypothetical protein